MIISSMNGAFLFMIKRNNFYYCDANNCKASCEGEEIASNWLILKGLSNIFFNNILSEWQAKKLEEDDEVFLCPDCTKKFKEFFKEHVFE